MKEKKGGRSKGREVWKRVLLSDKQWVKSAGTESAHTRQERPWASPPLKRLRKNGGSLQNIMGKGKSSKGVQTHTGIGAGYTVVKGPCNNTRLI